MNNKSSQDKISLKAAVIIGVNAMIGAGVLTAPAFLSLKAGPAGIFTIFFSVVFVLAIGLSLGRLTAIYPGQGWTYLYPSKWGGHIAGIISAFAYLIGIIVAMGMVAQQAGIWCSRIITFINPTLLSILILGLLTILVLAGTKIASWGQYLIVAFVLVPLLSTAAYCWLNFDNALLRPFMPRGVGSIFGASSLILFSFLGFESIASLYSSVQDPEKNVPKATLGAISIVGFTYLMFIYGVLFAVPGRFFVKGFHEPLASVLSAYFPSAGFLSILVLLGAIFGILGTIHSMLWSVSSLFTSVLRMTKSKLISKLLDRKIWDDKVSILVVSILICISAIVFKAEFLIYATTISVVLAYIFSCITLLFIKKEWKSGHNIITLIGLTGGGLMIYFSVLELLRLF